MYAYQQQISHIQDHNIAKRKKILQIFFIIENLYRKSPQKLGNGNNNIDRVNKVFLCLCKGKLKMKREKWQEISTENVYAFILDYGRISKNNNIKQITYFVRFEFLSMFIPGGGFFRSSQSSFCNLFFAAAMFSSIVLF